MAIFLWLYTWKEVMPSVFGEQNLKYIHNGYLIHATVQALNMVNKVD